MVEQRGRRNVSHRPVDVFRFRLLAARQTHLTPVCDRPFRNGRLISALLNFALLPNSTRLFENGLHS